MGDMADYYSDVEGSARHDAHVDAGIEYDPTCPVCQSPPVEED